MRRFSLIARLGAGDSTKVNVLQSDSAKFEIDFVDHDQDLRFGLGQTTKQLASLGLRVQETAIDLALLAALVRAGDTRISRAENAQDGWTREIDLYCPVSCPEIWNGTARHLESTLKFLTGDRWRIFFHARPSNFKELAPNLPTSDDLGFTEVSLLSGGLDSLVGAIDTLESGNRPLFVSHYWDAETSRSQSEVLSLLENQFGSDEINNVRVRLGFDKNGLATEEVEDSQRGRSFLFYTLAALAASGLKAPAKINVPENGLIALNVPLDPLRLGALSTRTAHPFFLQSMNVLFDRIGLSVTLNNSYQYKTKGEMVAECLDTNFLRGAVPSSMSCSSPAKARFFKLSPRHCGYCVPCLIRRASLKAGLKSNDPTTYLIDDLDSRQLDTEKAEGQHIRAFEMMAQRLKRNPELAKVLIHKPGPLKGSLTSLDDYAAVFLRGVFEVDGLLKGMKAQASA